MGLHCKHACQACLAKVIESSPPTPPANEQRGIIGLKYASSTPLMWTLSSVGPSLSNAFQTTDKGKGF